MAILVTCTCGKQLKVKDELAGKRGKCTGCGAILSIPTPSASAAREKVSASPLRNCPTCKEALQPNAVICLACGLDLRSGKQLRQAKSDSPDEPDEPTPKAPAPSSRLWIALIAGGALVALGICLAGVGFAAIKLFDLDRGPGIQAIVPKADGGPGVQVVVPKPGVSFTALGATADELKQRFGAVQDTKPSPEYPGAADQTHVAGNMRLIATVYKDKCGAANFETLDGSPFPAATIDRLLAANSEGFQWQPIQLGGSPTWAIRGTGKGEHLFLLAIWPDNQKWKKNRLSMVKSSLMPERAKDKDKTPPIELGESKQSPVLFFQFRPGMEIRIANTKYDAMGWVESFEANIKTDKDQPALVRVRTQTPAGDGNAPAYSAELDGKPLPRQSDSKLLGLSAKEPDGVVFALVGTLKLEMKLKFSYDSFDRRQVAQQNFTHEGKIYEITYADYTRDSLGQVTGYTTRIVKAE